MMTWTPRGTARHDHADRLGPDRHRMSAPPQRSAVAAGEGHQLMDSDSTRADVEAARANGGDRAHTDLLQRRPWHRSRSHGASGPRRLR
jgi:hypothetical protein